MVMQPAPAFLTAQKRDGPLSRLFVADKGFSAQICPCTGLLHTSVFLFGAPLANTFALCLLTICRLIRPPDRISARHYLLFYDIYEAAYGCDPMATMRIAPDIHSELLCSLHLHLYFSMYHILLQKETFIAYERACRATLDILFFTYIKSI
jgi:hypothetical protein